MTFAPTLAISAKLVQLAPLQRSITNNVSLLELSFQAKVIWFLDMAVAVKLLGAAGGAGVVALAAFEYSELPAEL